MSQTKAGAVGHPPEVVIRSVEQAKYEKMWEHDFYRQVSPGEEVAQTFLSQAKPLPDSTVIDFGCGTGRGALMLALFGKMKVTMLDFAANALDEEVANACVTQPHRISFIQHDLTKKPKVKAAYGYCTDVMEHLPPNEVDLVLSNILQSANHVFFQISCQDDVCGAQVGEELHLTVKPYEWWVKKFREHNCAIHWSRGDEAGAACQLYVSSWAGLEDVKFEGQVNTELEKVFKNMRENAKTEYQLIEPHPLQDKEVMMICGGPSLNDYTDEIKELRAKGMPLITTNGTYNWAIENGMKPSMQMVIDARKFNERFVTPVVDDCKYMIASQAHPDVFKGLPLDQTYIWHVGLAAEITELLDELYEIWFPCPGGSTVTLRGLCLLRMLGFHKIHMYGFDSCYRDSEHHAYAQPENDYKRSAFPVSVGGKVFMCDAWMYSQAKEFMGMVNLFGDEISLNVKGDGLIAHIINTGAALSALEENEE
jgi:SAM-dependent methyltransferase